MNWEVQIDLLTDEEVRRFNKNLFRYHKGEEVELVTISDKITWAGILPALEINKEKYEKKCLANQENSKLGGAPKGNQNASKTKTTQNNPNNPIKEKSEKTNEKSKKESDNGEYSNENWEKQTGKSQLETENRQDENEDLQDITDNLQHTLEDTGARITGENSVDVSSLNKNNLNKPDLPYNLSKKEHKDVLDEIFDRYPNWEQELTKSNNLSWFLSKYKNYLKQEARNGVEAYGDTEDNIFNWFNEFITSYHNR